jgi:cytochrome c-type biogenesis protein CcmE
MTKEHPENTLKKIVTSRKFMFVGLLLALILLSIYYVSNYQQHLEHPNTSVILKNYPLGETVAVSGIVTAVHNDGFTLLDKYHGIGVNYTVFSPEKVSNGDQVEVLGVLGDSYQIAASKILVISSFDYNFMLLRSGIALLIFLFFFRRYWRFDFKKMMFRRLK